MSAIPAGFRIVQGEGFQGSLDISAGFQVVIEGGQPYRATDDMSGLQRFLAGIGRGATEVGQGAKHLGLHGLQKVGLTDLETVAAYDDFCG